MSQIRDMLLDFHNRFNVPAHLVPRVPSDDRVRLRLALIVEECFELLQSCYEDHEGWECMKQSMLHTMSGEPISVDMIALADATADLAYVVEGANLEFGIDSDHVLEEVHRANMRKVGGATRADGKILKPNDWKAPDVEGVLRQQGWRP